MIKLLSNFLLVVSLVIIQVSLLSFWPSPVNNLNLILTLIIFITLIINYHQGLIWAFFSGLFLELFSVYNFGIVTFSLLLTVIILNNLFFNFFSHLSFYALLVLGFLGTIFYNLLILTFWFTSDLLKINLVDLNLDSYYFYQLFWQIVLNLIVLFVVFLIFNILSKKIKSTFLVSD